MERSQAQARNSHNFSEFELTEVIHTSSRTSVYRAVEIKSGKHIVIKALNNTGSSFKDIVRLQNYYKVAKKFSQAGIVRPLSFRSAGNSHALLLEDCGSISLEKYIKQRSLSLVEFLEISLQLAEIIQQLFEHRVIHKDINPAHILIHPESHKVTLIDFSIATCLPKEVQENTSPSHLEGTLSYLAPEQTGRMNRGIDFRADYYSLGITFYQLLSNQLPFTATEPLELIHSHIARQPVPINHINRQIPSMVSAITHKLMAKNAEDRYQSALGLKHDLTICLKQWKENRTISSFSLGNKDICDRFLIPEQLFGREDEVQTLLEAFERISRGGSELVLIAGSSGIGKTAVVNEVHKPITQKKGYFIQGKFDQFNRDLPFSAFLQAFRNLMGKLLGESDQALARWKAKILRAVGQNGQLLIQVVPELETIIGPQPKVEDLEGSASLARFNLVFSNFVQVFCAPDHPLVIFIDDLQWSDSGSLSLLELLLSELAIDNLLILGAYRDNEVSAVHPLHLTLKELENQNCKIQTVTLGAIKASDLNKLVASSLLCSQDVASPLATLIYQKTHGNPFFSIQSLKGLYEKGAIKLSESGQWQYDLIQVKQLSLTDNVVSLMIERLSQLPISTQQVLMQASCIGNRFELVTLATICEKSQEEIIAELWAVLQLGLVIPEKDSGQNLQNYDIDTFHLAEMSLSYRFLHDKVQQAVYSLIPDGDKERTHYQIGKLLINNFTEQKKEEKFFEIVNQLNFGISLIGDPHELKQLATLNLDAGKRAKASTAYTAAKKYFLLARKIILSIDWQNNYSITLNIYEELVETVYLNTDFHEFDDYFDEGLRKTQSLLDQIKMYEIKINKHLAQNQLKEAVFLGLEVINQLDPSIKLPEQPTPSDFRYALMETEQNIGDRSIHELADLPKMLSPIHLASVKILINVIPSAYIALPELLPFLTMQVVNLSIKYGNAAESAFGYATFGQLNCAKLKNIRTGYQFGRLALAIVEKYNAKQIEPIILLIFATFIQHWQDPIENSLKLLAKVLTKAVEVGSLTHAGYAASFYCCNALFSQANLAKLRDETRHYSETVSILKQTPSLNLIHIIQQTIQNFQENTASPMRLIGSIYDERVMVPEHIAANDRTSLGGVFICKLSLAYYFQDYDSASEASSQAARYIDGVFALPFVVIFNFFDSLTKLAQYRITHKDDRPTLLQSVQANQLDMKLWAEQAPKNNLHRFYLVEAEYARSIGQNLNALDYYDRAIASAQANSFLNEEALANERAALFFLEWGKEKAALGYLQEAYSCYSQWGAYAKTTQLLQDYPQISQSNFQSQNVSISYIDSLLSSQETAEQTPFSSLYPQNSISEALDFKTVIQSAQLLSSRLELKALFAQLMQLMIQTSGAETCALVIPEIKDKRTNNQEVDWQVQRLALPLVEGNLSKTTDLDIDSLSLPKSLVDDHEIPVSLINYVKNSGEVVQIEDLSHPEISITDEYLLLYKPKSVLIHPIKHQDTIVGVLYLENRQTAKVFHPLQRRVISFFCNQAGIALENAKLYKLQLDQAKTLSVKNQQLQIAKQNAEAANEAKSNFLKHVSHELRTPLNGILGYTQILQRSKTLSSNDAQGLKTIENCSYQLLTLINEVIDITQLDRQNLVLTPHEVHLPNSLQAIFAKYQKITQTNNLQFNYQISTECPQWVIVDEKRLLQVLEHILDNAVKYTHQGSIKVQVSEINRVGTISTLQFLIADTGIGITQEERNTLFQLFEQGKNGTNRASGLGMGLAISQHIIQQMKSDIILKSIPGEGSEFRFTLELPVVDKSSQTLDFQAKGLQNSTNQKIDKVTQTSKEILIPETSMIESLLQLSQAGRLRQIRILLEDLLKKDQNFEPFAAPLLKLASQFKIEKIESILSQHLELTTRSSE